MSNAIWAIGTLLKIGDGGTPTEVFTTIGEITNITGPGVTLDTIEVTNHSSPGGCEEHIPSVLRTGEVTFDINFVPGSPTQSFATGLIGDAVSRTLRNFELLFPNLVKWEFAGYVIGFEPDAPFDGKLGASVTVKPVGQPTLV